MKDPGVAIPVVTVAGGVPLQNLELRESLELLVRAYESRIEGTLGSVLLLDDEGRHLFHASGPSLPAEYLAAIDGTEIGPGAGSCGSAAYRGERVIVEDIGSDPLWDDYRELAARFGLASCWSQPVISYDDRVLGTFALYARVPRRPSDKELRLVAKAASLAAAFIDHDRAVGELKRQREQTERALQGSGLGLWEWDLPSDRFSADERLAAIVGRSPEELPATHARLTAMRHPEDAVAVEAALRRHLTGETPVFEAECRLRHGSSCWVWVLERGRVVARDERGRPLALSGTLLDVDAVKRGELERERLSQQLLHAQRLESVGRLAGGLAHEFNNLLVPIMGHAGLALSQHPGDDELVSHLETILSASDRARRLSHQLLAFGRQQILDRRPLDLNLVLREMEAMLRPLIGEDIVLQISASAELGAVMADRGQMEQVLMNLVLNARDAMPNGGRLEIVSFDRPAQQGALRQACLRVTDNGSGMDGETRQRLFDPFFTTKEVGQGTGLGLATVYGILEQHGGLISVESELDAGSSFEIRLPCCEQPAVTEEPTPDALPPASVGGEGRCVLLVEDEQAVRRLIRKVLEREGYEVLGCADAEQACAIAERKGCVIHLLLTDVIMPGLSGRQLRERLLPFHPGLHTLFVSGYTRDVLSTETTSEDGVDFLQKPFSPQKLCRKVRALIDA